MIEVKFKNLDRSDMLESAVKERIESVVDKFTDLERSRVAVTLEMENSRTQAGADLFSVKVIISGGRYKDVALEKSDANIYIALADVSDRLLDKLNRVGDKARVKQRNQARAINEEAIVHAIETVDPRVTEHERELVRELENETPLQAIRK